MIAASPQVGYISEPLNVLHRPGVLRAPTQHWYTYICAENQADYLPAFRETLRFRYHPWLELKSLRSLKDAGRMLRDGGWFLSGQVRRARPLLKDPFAVFSAPWFAQALGCRVVIAVRHPLAFVSSLKRLGWDFDFLDLLAQPLLMRDHLEPYQAEMEALLATPEDVIGQGSLLWRMVYTV
ncbi:MAG TPA: sulfotransferase family protein, partial [Chloroflexi bacterium]|nr:sulfotransferase family protein [Chloroflexota bacterium]